MANEMPISIAEVVLLAVPLSPYIFSWIPIKQTCPPKQTTHIAERVPKNTTLSLPTLLISNPTKKRSAISKP